MNKGVEITTRTSMAVDLEMHLEVKSEPDLDMFISSESLSSSADFDTHVNCKEKQGVMDELEDEPLVEIESITVPQQLVEVDHQPSLLFFVNPDPKICPKRNGTSIIKNNSVNSNTIEFSKEKDTTNSEDDIEIRKSITRALRNVKRKKNVSSLMPCENDIADDREMHEEENCVDLLSPGNLTYYNEEGSVSLYSGNNNQEDKELKTPEVKKVFTKTNKKRHKEFKNAIGVSKRLNKSANYITKNNIEIVQKQNKSFNKNRIIIEESTLKTPKENKKNDSKNKVESPNNLQNALEEITPISTGSLKCTIPGNEMKNVDELNLNVKSHIALKPESFECTVCGKTFRKKSHLATHSRAHVETRNYKCNECGGLFKNKVNLFFHMKTHEEAPFTCDKCNKTFAERKILSRHIRLVHSEGIYNCDQCGHSFKNARNLELHYTLHTGNKPFTCDVCSKSFVYKSTYTAHVKAHAADDQFNCKLCPSDSMDKAELRRRCSHHSEARPWLCAICGKAYPLKSTLKHHLKTHDPDKQFKCNECGKSFVKKSSYDSHLKSHSGDSPPFMCDQCSQCYYNAFALKRHYLKHTSERRFVCDVCNKAFWMKDALKVHKRSHTNIKMFQCSQCSRSFMHKHNLVGHSRSHSAEHQFMCHICSKTFSHKYNLDRHQRQHSLPAFNPPPLSPSFMMVGPPKHLEFPTLHIL